MTLRHILATNLHRSRKDRDLRQHQLAQRAACDQTFISHIERGSRDVTLATLESLASALGVPAYTLLIPPEEAP